MSSLTTAAVGGRLFPGVHHHAEFKMEEAGDRFNISISGKDLMVEVDVNVAANASDQSVFADLDEATRFFSGAPVGYSPSHKEGSLDAVRLQASSWNLEPLQVHSAKSSYLEQVDKDLQLDSAFLMRNIDAIWERVAATT